MARNAAYQTRYHNKLAIYIVFSFLVVFAVVLIVNCTSLSDKVASLESKKVEYQRLLETEKQEALDLQELEKATQTKKHYEQIARERLNMVYEDEILFKKKGD